MTSVHVFQADNVLHALLSSALTACVKKVHAQDADTMPT